MVRLPVAAWRLANRLSKTLTAKLGRPITIGQTVARALQCLDDAHTRGAWLSPREAAPLMEERNRRRMAHVMAQYIAKTQPDRTLRGMAFNPETESMTVEYEDGESVMVATRVEAAEAAATLH